MKLILKGIIPPVITPLLNDRELDVEGLERLVEHLIAGGVHGLFMLGTTGEATSLSYQLRKELLKRTGELVNRRIPIVAGITDTSLEESLNLAEYAATVGIDGLVIAPPYYMPISQEEMRDYLDNIVPRLPLPFLMYDMPGCTKLHMSVETIRKAKELGAIGVKDSSGDLLYTYALIDQFKDSPDFSIIAGTELFLPETILNGGHGAVAGGANLYPGLFVDLYRASVNRDFDRIAVLREKVILLNNTIYNVGKHYSRITKGIKCALSVMNICSDYMMMPLRRHSKEERKKIEQHISELNAVMEQDTGH
ncbi:dihydrodipicolinate synthase family protein [Gaoshiqia sp. Z1-71]|uniref:dihydrodipicolinate synthase family protein n=1 Tax=Gaoshiqia hydrogeniformans TaxID=3290090 RepID=UPI003BF89A06